MLVMNVATFVFNMIAARLSKPAEFGALTAMLGILMMASVVSLAIQATTARRLAVERASAEHVVAVTARATWLTSVALGGALALSSLVLTPLLRLDSYWPVVLCGATIVPLTIYGAQAGVAQGTGQWNRLSALYMAHGLGRLGFATAAIAVSDTVTSAMIGVAVAGWMPVLAGHGLLRSSHESVTSREVRNYSREAWLAGSTLLGFLALTNLDSLMSRVILDPHDSGLYAAGLILTKSTLLMPQFVSVVLFPRMARDDTGRSQLTAVKAVAGLGLLVVLTVAVVPGLVLVFVGGEQYEEVTGVLWLFALLGTIQAIVHILMFGAIARRKHAVTVVVWCSVAVHVAASVLWGTGVVRLALIGCAVCLGAALVLLVLERSATRAREAARSESVPDTLP